jgi:hypothetical protein
MYDTHQHALEAVRALESAGFSHDDVSIVAGNSDGRYAGDLPPDTPDDSRVTHADDHHSTKSGAGIGATLGTVVGGGAGLAAGLGALAIPGIGPIVAAGWLIAALAGAGAGAAAGGALGSLTGAGVDEAEAPVYAEGVRRGSSLVVVRAPEARMVEAEAILQKHGPVDLKSREADYRAGGWNGYEENVVPSQTTRPVPPIDRV